MTLSKKYNNDQKLILAQNDINQTDVLRNGKLHCRLDWVEDRNCDLPLEEKSHVDIMGTMSKRPMNKPNSGCDLMSEGETDGERGM